MWKPFFFDSLSIDSTNQSDQIEQKNPAVSKKIIVDKVREWKSVMVN